MIGELGLSGIIRTKITPPHRRVGLLHRPRLVDFLHEHVNRKLMLISAAPGYGKTSLLLDFLQDTELPTCWYAMDPSDADPWTFMEHFVSSVMETFPRLGEGSLIEVSGSARRDLSIQSIMQILVNDIHEKISDYFVILIDDFQYSDEAEEIQELVTWFLDHQPDNCCLTLASRTMPNLPFLKLAAQQEIAGLGTEDLAFTAEEIQAYLELNHNIQVPLKEAMRLADESEGWITGILLGTHTLWKGLLRSITAEKGKDEQVFDYLAQEVFDQQPAEKQRFLKSTSILSVMRPGICDRLLRIRNSSELLSDLEKANLFVSRLSGEQPVYRYHALFQGFLVRQFRPDDLEQKNALHRAAGDLLAQGEDFEEALEHYLAAGASNEAIELLHGIMESTYQAGRLVTLTRWMDSLEPEAIAGDVKLLIMRGRLHRQRGEFEQALELYRQAGSLCLDQGDQAGEVEVRIHEALVHRYRGAMSEARDLCEQVLSKAKDIPNNLAILAQAHRILGEYHHVAGNLVESKKAFRQSLQLYEQADDLYHAASLLQALGTTARRMGNPLEAEGHYNAALKYLERLDNRWRIADIKNNIGVGYYYQGEYDRALQILQEALSEARHVGHTRTEAAVLASLGDLQFELGNLREAQKLYQDSLEGIRESKDRFLEVYVLCAMASLYRIDQAWEQAYTLLEEADGLCGPEESGYMRGLVSLYRGVVCLEHTDLERALCELDSAVALLRTAGAKRELAKAHLWLANACHQKGEKERSFEQLRSAVEICLEIKHPHLLVADGSRMRSLIEEASKTGGDFGETTGNLLKRIHQYRMTLTRQPEKVVAREVQFPQIEIHAWGKGRVKVNGEPISRSDWGGPLVKELFFFLMENEPVGRDPILATFWPDYSPAKAKSVFHATLYRMRRVLPSDFIKYDNDHETYFIDDSIDFWYDVAAFEALLDQRPEGKENAEELLEQAVESYHDEFLTDFYSDWCVERRENLRLCLVEALVNLANLNLHQEEFKKAIQFFQRAITQEPYREDLHRSLMQTLARAGRSAEAVQHYDQYVDQLRQDLGIEPDKETMELYASIRMKHNIGH